ncbi:MAG: NifU family protein [Gemmatimonadales bacterium]
MIEFTERARAMVQQFLAESDEGDLALRIGMSGSPMSPQFDLTLVGMTELTDEEEMIDGGGFTVFARKADADLLENATVDYVERVNESGFEVRPARARRPGARTGAPTGPIADRVRDILETQVNPAIASHGGMISLVDVDETDVYVEMSGGCQGCALSRMTLKQGVERMLREAVPELTAVHDVTDHASGDNPYL